MPGESSENPGIFSFFYSESANANKTVMLYLFLA